MEILNVITKNGRLFGVTIQDGDEQYPIVMKSLHVPMFFDELQRSGWELHSLPYGFKKDGVSIEELPTITVEEAGIDDDKEQFLLDTVVGTYKEVDLKAKMVKAPSQLISFKESTCDIKTREELLDFLLINKDAELDIDTPMTYMPLNSFVAPEALFTVQEYFDPANITYRKLIEDRRVMSLRSFIRMSEMMIKTGLDPKFSAKQLVDAYFQWGICGLNLKAYDRKIEERNTFLGATIHSGNEDEMPYITEGVLTYMKTSGEIYKPAAYTGSTYKPAVNEMELEASRRELVELGFEYVCPVLLKTTTTTEVTTLFCDDVTIQYDESMIRFAYDGDVYTSHTIRASSPEDPGKKLPIRFFNLIDKEKLNELFVESYLNAASKEIAKRTTVHADVSSYKAILASGGGNASSFFKIMYNPNFGKGIAESASSFEEEAFGIKISDSQMVMKFSRDIQDYIRGYVDKSSQIYEDCKYVVESVVDGQLNVDSTFTGSRMDIALNTSKNLDYLKVAHRYLGISLSDIAKAILNITPDTPYLEFRGNEMAIRLPLTKRDMKMNGYIADCNEYKIEAAKTARWLHYVEEVYRELGPRGNPKPKHVAVKVLSFYRGKDDRTSFQVWNYVCDIIKEEIVNSVSWREQADTLELLPRIAAQAIFEIALKGQITFPKKISGRVLKLEEKAVNAVRACIVSQYDSTIALAETAISRDGSYYRMCVNATITDEYVIPNKGVAIPEKPFMPAWLDLRNYPMETKAVWVQKGYIPDVNFPGYSTIYKSVATTKIDIEVPAASIPETVAAYVQWAENYRMEYPKDEELVAPRHYVYEIYPGLLDEEEVAMEESHRKLDKPVDVHLWGLDPVTFITRINMLERFPHLRSLFEVVESEPEVQEGVRRFISYNLEDFFYLGSSEKMNFAPNFGARERPIAVRGNTIYFADRHINYTEVETLDPAQYAVMHVRGRKYIMEDINGKLWEVIV